MSVFQTYKDLPSLTVSMHLNYMTQGRRKGRVGGREGRMGGEGGRMGGREGKEGGRGRREGG